MSRLARSAIASVAAVGLLAGCASADGLSAQYRSGSQQNYVAGDGTILEIAPADRGDPVRFAGELDVGGTIDSEDLNDRVLVVNIWYASCPPCRVEAPDLQTLNEQFSGPDVVFLGLNVRDEAEIARAFATEFGITYPSLLDQDGRALLAFSDVVAPNAVPTTIVLDREHRIASRILGGLPDRSVLETLIESVVAETA